MKVKLLKRVFLILIVIFAAVFILRFIYELYGSRYSGATSYESSYSTASYYDMSNMTGKTQNYATARQKIEGAAGASVNYDQKYEMVSNMTSDSTDFENDENLIRERIAGFSGIIQTERSQGLEGYRSLWISAGVSPAKFDELVEGLKEIGTPTGFSVTKTDKTEDFRFLLSHRDFLIKTKDAYSALKTRGGDISDFLALESMILETEEQIMLADVSLGVFDESLSLCTVEFTLRETQEQKKTGGISLSFILSRAWYALEWTVSFYLIALVFVLALGFAGLGITFIWERITGVSGQKKKDDGKDDSAE
ncbi:DUF4349 domain-containing protein [Brucepastera parasyntrophica]|uniref:DUF4349 domain-containing protein n=1 Tax=Brucepastera parasyntrophica TaxID=2880008 RepID=UPI00210C776F|nr:DUF4349 domain-containing protein [Brucepastera parasyntrophica]ULQ59492.1 DUF4349 domain-containing protein [Brucepastera parasyntrophica]